jgi:hypothetical protein
VISFSLKSLFSSVIGGALLSNQLKSMTRNIKLKFLHLIRDRPLLFRDGVDSNRKQMI